MGTQMMGELWPALEAAGYPRSAYPSVTHAVQALIAEADARKAELRELMGLDEDMRLVSFIEGRFKMRPPSWYVGVLVASFKSLLDERDAPNYVELVYRFPDSAEEYRVLVQRPNRPTAYQLREKAEAERDAIRKAAADALEASGLPTTVVLPTSEATAEWDRALAALAEVLGVERPW